MYILLTNNVTNLCGFEATFQALPTEHDGFYIGSWNLISGKDLVPLSDVVDEEIEIKEYQSFFRVHSDPPIDHMRGHSLTLHLLTQHSTTAMDRRMCSKCNWFYFCSSLDHHSVTSLD